MNFMNLFRHPAGLRDLSPDELETLVESDAVVCIDVRTSREFHHGHVAGAVSLPFGREAKMIETVSKNASVVFV